MQTNPNRETRWYFGGIASSIAACFTHPLDLVKVHLQTVGGISQSPSLTTGRRTNVNLLQHAAFIVKSEGTYFALYNGLSASILRQLTYATTRFSIYSVSKKHISMNEGHIPLSVRIAIAALAGCIGGIVGTPGDMINVRMQNDIKLPLGQRRNYKHAGDGLIRTYRDEGFRKIFSGVEWASSRAAVMNVGQLVTYDVVKQSLMNTNYFDDNLVTHFTSSVCAAAIATALTQPLDVLKTRAMNSQSRELNGTLHLIISTARQGFPWIFYRGFVPAFARLGPQTILTFVFLEQLRLRFGYLATPDINVH